VVVEGVSNQVMQEHVQVSKVVLSDADIDGAFSFRREVPHEGNFEVVFLIMTDIEETLQQIRPIREGVERSLSLWKEVVDEDVNLKIINLFNLQVSRIELLIDYPMQVREAQIHHHPAFQRVPYFIVQLE